MSGKNLTLLVIPNQTKPIKRQSQLIFPILSISVQKVKMTNCLFLEKMLINESCNLIKSSFLDYELRIKTVLDMGKKLFIGHNETFCRKSGQDEKGVLSNYHVLN